MFEVEGSLENKTLNLVCHGVVEDYQDFKDFKAQIFRIAKTDGVSFLKSKTFSAMNIKFMDSHPLTNEMVGFMLKLLYRDKVKVSVATNDNRVFKFLDHLHLQDKLDVKLFSKLD